METTEPECVEVQVRDVRLRLVSYTRALKLCALMNRELEVLDFIDGIPEGAVLYDLGACEGRFALYAALRGVRCYAFEPEGRNFQAMMENQALNGADAERFLFPINAAVGATTHRAMLKIGQPWAGGHQRVLADVPSRGDLAFEFQQHQDVQVLSLDDCIAVRGLPLPDALKVDVDGSELPLLEGARETLSQPQLRRIIFELHQGDSSYDAVLGRLAEHRFAPVGRHEVETGLFNVVLERKATKGGAGV